MFMSDWDENAEFRPPQKQKYCVYERWPEKFSEKLLARVVALRFPQTTGRTMPRNSDAFRTSGWELHVENAWVM